MCDGVVCELWMWGEANVIGKLNLIVDTLWPAHHYNNYTQDVMVSDDTFILTGLEMVNSITNMTL